MQNDRVSTWGIKSFVVQCLANVCRKQYQNLDASSTALLSRNSEDFLSPNQDNFEKHDGDNQNIQLASHHPSRFHKVLSIICKILIVVFAFWGFLDIILRASVLFQPKLDLSCWCGTSDAEAIAMGCKYDHLAVDWLPPHCIDDELTAEFDRAGPGPSGEWDYYTEPKSTAEQLNYTEIDEYAVVAKDYYATSKWHMAHCVFIWRKQFRAKTTGKVVEPWNENEEHIMHCGTYFMERNNVSDWIDTIIPGTDRHPHDHGE